jgi:predicted extracellular nuclease
VHEGNSQAIDHILVSNVLLEAVEVVDAVHLHAEYPWVMTEPDGTVVERASDHDPLVAVFAIAA